MLATGGSLTTGVLYWTVFGLLYHLAGYGHNSWADWKNGYDSIDPNKQHHPLNSGALRPWKAKTVVYSLLLITLAWSLFGTVYYNSPTAFILILIALGSGYIYNEMGKGTVIKFIPIALAHSMVFAVPYVALGGSPFAGFFFIWALVLMWIVFQIAISGEVKDINQVGEMNLIRTLGYKEVRGVPMTPKIVVDISLLLRSVIMGAGFFAVLMYAEIGVHLLLMGVVVLVGMKSIYDSIVMVKYVINDRDKSLKLMSRIEIYSMMIFLLAISPVISFRVALLVMTASGIWLTVMNKHLWGTYIAPDV